MHVRVRVLGKPEAIVVVDSKLTKIDQLRKQISKKCDIEPKLQRLFYGGKLLEDGYTFHDYGIKLNDVIQVMVKVEPLTDSKTTQAQKENPENNIEKIEEHATEKIVYTDAKSKLYGIGDLVDMKYRELGAWFEGQIIRIVDDPDYVKLDKDDIKDISQHEESLDMENKPLSELTNSNSDVSKKKGIAGYFSKKPKNEEKQFTKTSKEETLTEEGILYIVKMEAEGEDADETEYVCKLHEIRPRARKIISVGDLKVGMKVMINHNCDDFTEKGYWYDFKIAEIVKRRKHEELVGTLYIGAESIPQNDTKAKILDYIYEIEEVVPLSKRTEEYQKMMTTPTTKRSAPLNCLSCRDDEDAPCRDCGCYKCSGKEFPDKIILCDECNHGYHMSCLAPPLTELPSEDWYCPDCKREDKIVAPGAAKQAKKGNASKSKRDWGRGMACVGKTKSCTMPSNHFGPIPGIEVGMRWRFRIQISESGVHRPPVSGIHGRDVEGAYSIVLSGGYEDDYDDGFEFTYTGSGGRDLSGNKRTAEQSCDQTLTRENKALARNCAANKISEEGNDAGEDWRKGKPVRVVRSYKMMKHFPQYAPQEGIRYDGIYKVVKYYPETGKSGFRVWKYLLRRDDPSPAPWEPLAKQYPIVYPDGYLEAEAEKKAMKAQGKGPKAGKKRKLPENQSSESADDAPIDDSPPNKKKKNVKTPETAKKRGRKPKNDSIKESPKGKITNLFVSESKSAIKTNGVEETKSTEISDNILSKAEMEAIQADNLNSKPWNECLEVCKTGTKKDFVEQVTELFLCIICQDVPASPVTTSCLHNFCMGCIKLAFKSTGGKACPCCRRDLSKEELQPNDALRDALRAIMPGYDIGKK